MLGMWLWIAGAPPAEASALCEALQADLPRIEAVRAALEAGEDPDAVCWLPRDHAACLFLLLFVLSGPVALVFMPLGGPQEVPPVSLALRTGDVEIVTALLDAGARLPPASLDVAVAAGGWGVVDLLLDRGAPPVLHRLDARVDEPSVLQQLQSRQIRLDQVELIVGSRALSEPRAADRLLEAGVPAQALFDSAIEQGSSEVAAMAMERAGVTRERAYRLLIAAAEDGSWRQVEWLREAGVGWSLPGYPPATELLARSMDAWALRGALAWGLDPSAPEQRGSQVLAEAVQRRDAAVAAALLDAGVAWDRALFERAVDWGDWELIGPFLARGADLQGTDIAQRARAGEFDHEVTDAARRGDLGDLERLIALGASPDGGRIPALSVAASEAVEAALIAAGADPSRARPRPEPRERPTELHRAVQDGAGPPAAGGRRATGARRARSRGTGDGSRQRRARTDAPGGGVSLHRGGGAVRHPHLQDRQARGAALARSGPADVASGAAALGLRARAAGGTQAGAQT
jgi:hypothetical protein